MLETVAREKYVFGPYEVDFQLRELRKFGTRVKIQRKPLAVLELLLMSRGNVVSRDQLREALWSDDNVFVDFDKNLGTAVNKLREALCDTAEEHRYIETVPRFGYRFVAEVSVVRTQSSARPAVVVTNAPVQTESPGKNLKRRFAVIAAAVACSAAVIFLYASFSARRQPSVRHSVILADFENFTGEQVFNGTLRQSASFRLKHSRALEVLSDARMAEQLELMERPKDSPVIGNIAHEICQRSGSTAVIEGSVTNVGAQYVLALKAKRCFDGDLLAHEQFTADRKEDVVSNVEQATLRLEDALSGMLRSEEKPERPLELVTTPSLEALKAYTLGYRAMVEENESVNAIKFLQRAVEIDPEFAMAYARLAVSYGNAGLGSLATENIQKAYELRDKVSLRERLYIDARYENYVTGDLEANRRTLELWTATYPDDAIPHAGLGNTYSDFGDYERSLKERQLALKLSDSALNYGNLAASYISLNRLEEAKATVREGIAHNADSHFLDLSLYHAAILENDFTTASRVIEELVAKRGLEADSLQDASNTSVFLGKFSESRELTQRAAEAALRADLKETAGSYFAQAALREALAGNASEGRIFAKKALELSSAVDVIVPASFALGYLGDQVVAERTAKVLNDKHPSHTVIQSNYIPCLRAAAALARRDAPAALAITSLASPYELGSIGMPFYPIYLRGLSYLALGDSLHARNEFQKILDHPGIVTTGVLRPLSQLGVARAYVLSGEREKAKLAYEAFFAFWKDADADLIAIKAARVEFSALK